MFIKILLIVAIVAVIGFVVKHKLADQSLTLYGNVDILQVAL